MGLRIFYTLLLVAVTAVWGWTFVVVQDAIVLYGVLPFLAVRFALAGAALAPIYARKLTRRSLLVGGGIGVVLAAGYLFQTTGLLFTTPTNSGLITGLFVVFAPLADRLLFGASASRQVVVAVVLSLLGMILFADVSFPPAEVWVALLVTGLLASAGAFLVQTTVQQHIPAARTAIVLTMEPVFAALFGYWLAGDRLVAVQIFGALMILSALVIGEVVPVLRRGKRTASGPA